MQEKLLTELLSPVYIQLKRAETGYRNYQANGKTYLYARIIREANTAIRDLILQKAYLQPEELEKEFMLLLEHIDIWDQKWLALEKELQPHPDQPFIFQNSHTFPREAARQIESLYLQLKREYSEIPPTCI